MRCRCKTVISHYWCHSSRFENFWVVQFYFDNHNTVNNSCYTKCEVQWVIKFSLFARVWHFPAANVKYVRISSWQKLESHLGKARQNYNDQVHKKAPEIIMLPSWVFPNENVYVFDYWNGWHFENELYAFVTNPFLTYTNAKPENWVVWFRVFFWKLSRLSCWDVTSFCVQLKNQVERQR